MNTSSSNCTNSDTTVNCFTSKIRRLKIQESVLTANVNRCNLLQPDEIDGRSNYNNDLQLKQYLCKLKDSFREIKNLFDEITVKATDQESLANTDIDEFKKEILELETKIRSVKQYVTNELHSLRNEEITLKKKDITSERSTEGKKVWRCNVPQLKGFKEIVPSPVRLMIHSPFKCLEVQQFQDFMKNSPNRYGGWNEYNHNIFVHIWNKYNEDNVEIALKLFVNTFTYQDFVEEVLQKIPGCSLDSIDSHSKWYSNYLHLKINQQEALNKWKDNKRKIKPMRKAQQMQIEESTTDDLQTPVNIKLCRKQQRTDNKDRNINQRNRTLSDTFTGRVKESTIPKLIRRNEILSSDAASKEVQRFNKKIHLSRLMHPTVQWLNKLDSPKETYKNNNIENLTKLRIPSWRLNLRE